MQVFVAFIAHIAYVAFFFSWKLARECRVGFITLLGRRKCNINFCICIRCLRMITLHTCYIVFPTSLISIELLMILRQLLCSLPFFLYLFIYVYIYFFSFFFLNSSVTPNFDQILGLQSRLDRENLNNLFYVSQI